MNCLIVCILPAGKQPLSLHGDAGGESETEQRPKLGGADWDDDASLAAVGVSLNQTMQTNCSIYVDTIRSTICR